MKGLRKGALFYVRAKGDGGVSNFQKRGFSFSFHFIREWSSDLPQILSGTGTELNEISFCLI